MHHLPAYQFYAIDVLLLSSVPMLIVYIVETALILKWYKPYYRRGIGFFRKEITVTDADDALKRLDGRSFKIRPGLLKREVLVRSLGESWLAYRGVGLTGDQAWYGTVRADGASGRLVVETRLAAYVPVYLVICVMIAVLDKTSHGVFFFCFLTAAVVLVVGFGLAVKGQSELCRKIEHWVNERPDLSTPE